MDATIGGWPVCSPQSTPFSLPSSKSSNRRATSGLRVSQMPTCKSTVYWRWLGRWAGRHGNWPGGPGEWRMASGLGAFARTPGGRAAGFINLTLSNDFLAGELRKMAEDPASLGVTGSPQPLTVVVDYAAPNAAKQMHVGHLRSTIIGDSLVRLLELVGHQVVRENHIGDWATALRDADRAPT